LKEFDPLFSKKPRKTEVDTDISNLFDDLMKDGLMVSQLMVSTKRQILFLSFMAVFGTAVQNVFQKKEKGKFQQKAIKQWKKNTNLLFRELKKL